MRGLYQTRGNQTGTNALKGQSVLIEGDATTSFIDKNGVTSKAVADVESQVVLKSILHELKVMNLHLQSISGLEVEAGDV